MLYYEEKAVWPEYCSHIRVYPSAPERDVKRYFKTVSKDTRKELIALNTMLQKERLARYKFAVFFVKRVIRTFYFSSLPKYVSTHLYNKCPTCQQYYVEDSKSNSYKRVGGKKKIRNTLTENEAWMFVYDKLIRRGICMMI